MVTEKDREKREEKGRKRREETKKNEEKKRRKSGESDQCRSSDIREYNISSTLDGIERGLKKRMKTNANTGTGKKETIPLLRN